MTQIDVTWLGQAGYLLEFEGYRVCIDPYLSDAVEREEGLKRLFPAPLQPEALRADFVILTHDHLDHLDPDTLPAIAKASPATCFAGPKSCMQHLALLQIENRRLFARGDMLQIGSLSFHGVFSKHTPDSIGLVVQPPCSGGIYFTGDTEYDSALLQVCRFHPEILFTCINGKLGNMGYQYAALLARMLEVHIAIPNHYGLFRENTEDPEKFLALLSGTKINAFPMNLMETKSFWI